MVRTRSKSAQTEQRTGNNMADLDANTSPDLMDDGCDGEAVDRTDTESDTDRDADNSEENGLNENGVDTGSEEEGVEPVTENGDSTERQVNNAPMSVADREKLYHWLVERGGQTDSDPEIVLSHVAEKAKKTLKKRKKRREKAPDRYKGGSQSWDDYWKTFCEVAKWNNWDSEDTADALRMHVQGEAAEYLHDLRGYTKMTLEKLKKAMSKRFGDGRHLEADKSALRNRKKKPEETYEQLAQNIRRLAQRVYRRDEELAESAACETFIRAIQDTEIKKGVAVARPTTLRECVEQAIYMDDFLVGDAKANSSGKIKTRNVVDEDYIRQVVRHISNEHGEKPSHQARQAGYVVDPTPVLGEASVRGRENAEPTSSAQRGRGKRRDWSNVECYHCHGYGHMARSCPERKEETNNLDAQNQRGVGRRMTPGGNDSVRGSDGHAWRQDSDRQYSQNAGRGYSQSRRPQRGHYRGRGRGNGQWNQPRNGQWNQPKNGYEEPNEWSQYETPREPSQAHMPSSRGSMKNSYQGPVERSQWNANETGVGEQPQGYQPERQGNE
jgi:hypothetical protein